MLVFPIVFHEKPLDQGQTSTRIDWIVKVMLRIGPVQLEQVNLIAHFVNDGKEFAG